jgi:hypothetical protein
MSAPNTDPEKQKRGHRVPLIGMGVAAVFGVVLIIFWLFGAAEDAPTVDPDAGETAPAATEG